MGIQKEVVCGIDIGGTNTVLGIVDIEGNCHNYNKLSTIDYDTAEDFTTALSLSVKELLSSLKFDYSLHGVGIGAPNANFFRGTIEEAPNLRWKGIIPLASLIESSLGVPTVLTNDANAAAIGEGLFGGAKGMKNFIVITLGTGIGSGIVIDGKLLYGVSGFAGELGHTIIAENGRSCGCGRKGCLETYVSASGISKTAIELLMSTKESSLLRGIHIDKISPKEIFIAAQQRDSIALEVFEITGNILGLSIANTVALFSPEAIFLFGGITGAGETLMSPIRRSIEKNILPIFRNSFKIEISKLDENMAAIMGSAALAWNEIKL